METLVHGTCVALGGSCALLRGRPGAGKSDLALRFLFLPAEALVQPEASTHPLAAHRRANLPLLVRFIRGKSSWRQPQMGQVFPRGVLAARPSLVADDQVRLRREDGYVVASCPAPLAGKIEVRGVGIARINALAGEARLFLIADLDRTGDQPRFPQSWQWETVLGLPVRRIVLDPFELSAPVKLALALQNLLEDPAD